MLTAEDVLNQQFQIVKLREGYDQDEVDDFLDRIGETLAERVGGVPPPAVGPGSATAPAPPASTGPVRVGRALSAGDLVSRVELVRAARVSTAADALGVRLPDGTRVAIVDLRATPDGIELTDRATSSRPNVTSLVADAGSAGAGLEAHCRSRPERRRLQ